MLGAILENGKEFDHFSFYSSVFPKRQWFWSRARGLSQGQDNCVLLHVGKNPSKFSEEEFTQKLAFKGSLRHQKAALLIFATFSRMDT